MPGNAPSPGRNKRVDVKIKVNLKYPDRETFVERFAQNLSRTGIFVRTADPAPVGSRISFEYRLADNSRILRGLGIVRWARRADTATPDTPPGMGLEFIDLDPQTDELIHQIVAERGDGERAPQRQKSVPPTDGHPAETRTTETPLASVEEANLDAEEQSALDSILEDSFADMGAPDELSTEASNEHFDLAVDAEVAVDVAFDPLDETTREKTAERSDNEVTEALGAFEEEEPQIAPAPMLAAALSAGDWIFDACGAALLSGRAVGDGSLEIFASELRIGVDNDRVIPSAEGMLIPALLTWAGRPWPSAHSIAATRRLGISLSPCDNHLAITVGETTVALSQVVNILFEQMTMQLPQTPVTRVRVILPATTPAATGESLRKHLLAAGVRAVELIPDPIATLATLATGLSAGAFGLVVDASFSETRASLIRGPAEVVTVHSAPDLGFNDIDMLVADVAATAFLRLHTLDVDDDPTLKSHLIQQIGALRRNGQSGAPWQLTVAGAPIEVGSDVLGDWLTVANERIALMCERILTANGLGHRDLASVVLTSEEPLWPGLDTAITTLVGVQPVVVETGYSNRLQGTAFPNWCGWYGQSSQSSGSPAPW